MWTADQLKNYDDKWTSDKVMNYGQSNRTDIVKTVKNSMQNIVHSNSAEIRSEPKPTRWQQFTGAIGGAVNRTLANLDTGAKNLGIGLTNAARTADQWVTSKIAPRYAEDNGGFLFGKTLDPVVEDLERRRDESNQNAQEGASGVGRLIGGAIQSIPQMTTPLPVFFAASSGQYARDAEQKGANLDQRALYGLVGGGIETGLEKAFGVAPGFKNLGSKGIIGNVVGEAVEEAVTEPLTGLAEKAIFNKDLPWFSTEEEAVVNPVEMGRSALSGAILGGFASGADALTRQNAINSIEPSIKPGTEPGVDYKATVVQEQTNQPQQTTDQAQKIQDKSLTQQNTSPERSMAASETDASIAINPQARIYGEQPKGEIPEGMRERGFSRNIRTDEAMPDDIRRNFDENPDVYNQLSDQETLRKAQEIFNKGQTEAEADFYQSIAKDRFRPEDVPLAKLLAKQASDQGDTAKARQILSSVAEKLTEAGQFSQAAKILREADPETFLMTMDKLLKKLNEQGKKKYGKKWSDVDLTPSEIEAIMNIPRGDQKAYDQTWEQIGDRIAKTLPSSKMEKFNAWRRMAMLLNPKTHIKNIGGNVLMMGMRKASDTVGAVLQKAFVPEGQRTQSVGWSRNNKVVETVNQNWETVKKDLLGESRWKIDNLNSISQEKRVFKKGLLTKAAESITGKQFDRGFVQWLNDVSLKTLNLEDNIFTERAYKDALGQYLYANNMDTVTDAAVEYATRRALEATFKQTNMLASFINKAKNVPVVGFFVEGAITFTKTPANIAMRGIEYSPGGLFKALYDVKAKKSAATIIEDLSKGLTGTGIAALGFLLAAMGWAKVDRERSEKAESLYQELGDQTYAINTPFGSYTFDWAQPIAIPFAMGIAAEETIRKRKEGSTIIQAVADGIYAGGDTIFNMTMLQNIREILGSYGSPTEKISGIPIDYLEQAIFSAFGQIARTIDPVRRSTYDPDPTKQWWNSVKAKIPFLSQTLEPALDIWGQEQSQGGAIQQFLSPGYYRERSDDAVTQEIARLYESVQDTDMLPKTIKNKVGDYQLSPEEKTRFARIYGQRNYINLRALIRSASYKSASDEQKAKMVKKIVNDNYDIAKQAVIGGATRR
jgi:hypothetical protein